ncbi:SMI1/KNR4 family protein [Tateyamaria armeniaca]|uniref:SMI1/KNR4 family protein n=1 Tax=Tateyamaria armeniaca TaxID=2518930 RepID=A0ABW8UTP3_9RHOB
MCKSNIEIALSKSIHLKPHDVAPEDRVFSRAEVEQQLGHILPPAMEDLLRPTGAPASFEEDVRIKVVERNQMTDKDGHQRVLVLYGMTSGKDGIVAKYNTYRGRFARRSTPFAEDGLGNLFVVDAVSGQVKYWYHECPEGEASPKAMTLVAEDFESFVSGLEAIKEQPNPEMSRGVTSARFDF